LLKAVSFRLMVLAVNPSPFGGGVLSSAIQDWISRVAMSLMGVSFRNTPTFLTSPVKLSGVYGEYPPSRKYE
jgi:hypothetical protein